MAFQIKIMIQKVIVDCFADEDSDVDSENSINSNCNINSQIKRQLFKGRHSIVYNPLLVVLIDIIVLYYY